MSKSRSSRGHRLRFSSQVLLILPLLVPLPSAVAEQAAVAEHCAQSQWRLLFVNDPHGEDVQGDRAALLDAIRRGSPIRVAWGEADADGKWTVEEFSNASFTNIIGGRDVVAQLQPALIQTSYIAAESAGLGEPLVEWHAIMATDGRFETVMVSRETGMTVRTLAQRTTMHWYAFAPGAACDTRPLPELAPSGRKNIQVDKGRDE